MVQFEKNHGPIYKKIHGQFFLKFMVQFIRTLMEELDAAQIEIHAGKIKTATPVMKIQLLTWVQCAHAPMYQIS